MRQLNIPTPGFGITLHTALRPGLDQAAEALDAEQLGYDVVTLHRDALHGDDPSFENWTLLSWLAARTTRISVAPLVLALPHRHPALLAKMAETLDRLSGGRLILILGGGGPMNEPAYWALGLESRSPGEKVQALEEAIEILRGLWSTSGFTYPGKHFRTDQATIEPKPAHAIPVLVDKRNVTTRGQIAGSSEEVARQLADVVRHGFTFLNLWPVGEAAKQRGLLAREVLPIVRDIVG
jgi:alkanesulfonate monooxygenase SsuD/methylene tetrahydromethanopterin reductase-like flavin-dependent oxidoreductase (luciferase family)